MELLGAWSTWSRSTWSELGGAARDVVDVVVDVVGARQSRSRRGRRGPWLAWLELNGAARDVVDVIRGRRGCSSSSVVGDGVGVVGAAFAAAGVLVVVIGLCVDQAWLLGN